ncbi:MAG TPA: hypothetical protein VMS56_14000 [Thermoanaerobaculia bacterium]|nr:hypothetical protein [Thermoanaerobaculia bacterium]
MLRSKRTLMVGLAAVALTLGLILAIPGESSANLGGRADVRRVELIYRTNDGSSQAHFYTAAGPVVVLRLESPEDVGMMLGMSQALAAERGRMWVDLEDGRVRQVILSAGR